MRATAETLAGIRLFERLSQEERDDIAARCRLHRFEMGDDIVRKRAMIAQPPTHSGLAAAISTNREAVTRGLNHLETAGLIARAGEAICVLDIERLQQMVEEVSGAES